MKSKTIYVLRHGETDLNRKGMVQGRGVDSSLNETGMSQALKVYEALRSKDLHAIYASSLKRSQETVKPFEQEGLIVKKHSGFDEISWGNQEGKKATFDAKNLYADTVNGWRSGQLSLNVGGGESPIQVMERQKEAMRLVVSDDSENILICMHGRALRILLCWLLNYPLNYMDGFPHANCAYYRLTYVNDTFRILEFNQTDHLI